MFYFIIIIFHFFYVLCFLCFLVFLCALCVLACIICVWTKLPEIKLDGDDDDVNFFPARRYASAVLAIERWLSVRPSHAGIVPKRLNLS